MSEKKIRPKEEARTVKQTAEAWGCSQSAIKRWLAQGRLTTWRPGREWLILDEDPPEKGAALTPEQRSMWPSGYKPTGSPPGRPKKAAKKP